MTERNHEIVKGVHITKHPDDMSRDELIDTLYDTAQFASNKLYESIAMRRILEHHLNK